MKKIELKEIWKSEEKVAHIHGWDFSHINGRYEEEMDLPWDYKSLIEQYINNDMNIKDNTETNEESKQDDIEKYIAEIKSENISNEKNNLNSNKIFAISAGILLLIILVKIIFF